MKTENRNKLLLMLAVLILVILGCTELTVKNNTDVPIRITVTMPKESVPESVLLDRFESDTFFSDYDGTYTLTAIADEDYRARLMELRDDMNMLLIEGFAVLSVNDIRTLTNKISNIGKLLENMDSVSCSGYIEEDGKANASVTVDVNAGQIVVNCN